MMRQERIFILLVLAKKSVKNVKYFEKYEMEGS